MTAIPALRRRIISRVPLWHLLPLAGATMPIYGTGESRERENDSGEHMHAAAADYVQRAHKHTNTQTRARCRYHIYKFICELMLIHATDCRIW